MPSGNLEHINYFNTSDAIIAAMNTPPRTWSNQEIAEVFQNIADLLDIKGENVYKILAYRRTVDILNDLGEEVNDIWQSGRLAEVPGFGKAIAEKIDELLSTGQLGFLERLKEEVPGSLLELLRVPSVGPRKAALFWKQAGITNLAMMEFAARAGKLRQLPGMGEKSEMSILEGIASLRRRSLRIPLGRAWQPTHELLAWLRSLPGVSQAQLVGSMRRMCSTVGGIDLAASAGDPLAVLDAFSCHPKLAVNAENPAPAGSFTTLRSFIVSGMRLRLWVEPEKSFGSLLQWVTGAKAHNARLAALAAVKPDALYPSEEAVYAALGMPWIPPELREDHGEIEAALAGNLPHLLQDQDLAADLHCHTTWSDGRASIQVMSETAVQRGLKVLAITDHTHSLGIANGLTVERLMRQREELDAVQRLLGDRLLLLHGSEVEIHADGTLDFPDEVLARLDFVVASLHTSLRQPRDVITPRLINAIRNPHVDAIGHPTGGLLPDRESSDLDMDAVIAAAAECGTALEINANPARLDLDDVHSRQAAAAGIKLTINRDAHFPEDLGRLEFGAATARRGWVQKSQVINTWPAEQLLAWLRTRP
jgi:DNA polymerase (family 10)